MRDVRPVHLLSLSLCVTRRRAKTNALRRERDAASRTQVAAEVARRLPKGVDTVWVMSDENSTSTYWREKPSVSFSQ